MFQQTYHQSSLPPSPAPFALQLSARPPSEGRAAVIHSFENALKLLHLREETTLHNLMPPSAAKQPSAVAAWSLHVTSMTGERGQQRTPRVCSRLPHFPWNIKVNLLALVQILCGNQSPPKKA